MAVCGGSGKGNAGYSGSGSPSVSEDTWEDDLVELLDQIVGNGNRIVPNCVAACSGSGAVGICGSGNGAVVHCGVVVVVWFSGELFATKGPGPESLSSESGNVGSDMGVESPSWGNTARTSTGCKCPDNGVGAVPVFLTVRCGTGMLSCGCSEVRVRKEGEVRACGFGKGGVPTRVREGANECERCFAISGVTLNKEQGMEGGRRRKGKGEDNVRTMPCKGPVAQ